MAEVVQRPRRVSTTVREGPKNESRTTKEWQETVSEIFCCCEAESSCIHRKSLASKAKISATWSKVSEIPSDLMPFAMEGAVKLDDETGASPTQNNNRRSFRSFGLAPGGAEHESYETLDDFQRAIRCLKSDYKTFAASNFDRFVKEDEARAMNEIWPPLSEELRKTAAMSTNGEVDELGYPIPISSFAESFHEPASKRFPVAVVELYKSGNEDGARELLTLVFEFITSDNTDISMYWTACMERLIEACNSSNVQKDMYPIITETLASPTASSNAKMGASKLLRKLAGRFNHEVIQKRIFPLMDSLARDKDPMVRTAAASNLPEMIHRIKNKDPAWKLIKVLSHDTDFAVKNAILGTIIQSVTLMNAKDPRNKTFLENVMHTIKILVKDAYVKGNIDLLVVYSSCMGRCAHAFSVAGVLQPRDILWYLDAFLQLSRYQANKNLDGQEDAEEEKMPAGFANFRANMDFNRRHSIIEALISTKAPGQVDRDHKVDTQKAIAVLRANAESRRVSIPFGGIHPSQCLRAFGPDLERAHECRANAAKEFYEFMLFAKPIVDFRFGLHPLLVELMHDSRAEVRSAMASQILPIMEHLGSDAGLMHGELVYALSDDDLDVIQGIVPGLAKILRCLVSAKILSPDVVTPKLIEVGGAILFCEERLNQSTYYTVHQTMLEQLTVLPFCLPGDYIYSNFVPSLFHRLRHMRQVPCRLAAANAIIMFLRHCRRASHREEIRKRIKEGFAQGRSVHDRMLFLYMAKKIMEMFSRKYFRDHFFEDVLTLANDPIVNVRRKVIELMPELRNTAEDFHYQKQLDETVRNARRSEVDREVKSTLELVLAKIGNKAALEAKGDIKLDQQPLINFQRVRDPTDEAKEKEEAYIASLEHKAIIEDISQQNVKQKRKSFYGTKKA